jgi:hypothetical protein
LYAMDVFLKCDLRISIMELLSTAGGKAWRAILAAI